MRRYSREFSRLGATIRLYRGIAADPSNLLRSDWHHECCNERNESRCSCQKAGKPIHDNLPLSSNGPDDTRSVYGRMSRTRQHTSATQQGETGKGFKCQVCGTTIGTRGILCMPLISQGSSTRSELLKRPGTEHRKSPRSLSASEACEFQEAERMRLHAVVFETPKAWRTSATFGARPWRWR